MYKLIPTKIKRLNPYLLYTEWNDGKEFTISLESFRKECPCAECRQDELNNSPKQFSFNMFKPGMNELESLKSVGNYAVRASWKDGHDTGIYTWENLRDISEKHCLSDAEIKKYDDKSKA